MRRTQIYLQVDQDQRLARRAAARRETKSTLIREAIEAYLDAPADDTARLARFRTALDEVAASPATLAGGAEYVERMRANDERRQDEIERRRR